MPAHAHTDIHNAELVLMIEELIVNVSFQGLLQDRRSVEDDAHCKSNPYVLLLAWHSYQGHFICGPTFVFQLCWFVLLTFYIFSLAKHKKIAAYQQVVVHHRCFVLLSCMVLLPCQL